MPKQTLSDVVGIRGINWEVLYTYNPFDIAEFLVKKTTGKEFMLPYCKTSMIPDNLFKLAMDSDCSIRYYKQD
jgi:hypothetical protein